VRVLMNAGADARKGIYPHRDATTAWQMAADRGFDDIVAIIEEAELRRREDASCPNATISPVQDQINQAIREGRNNDAIALLSADPSLVKACDRDGANPLHIAAGALNEGMVRWLLEHRASVGKTNLAGQTPLDLAVLTVDSPNSGKAPRFKVISEQLISRGAPLTALAAIALGDVDRLKQIQRDEPEQLRPRWFAGPLAVAVRHGNRNAVEALLDMGIDPDERTRLKDVEEEVFSWGGPLWYAAASGAYDIAELLLARGADPNAQVYASGDAMGRAYDAHDDRMKAILRNAGARVDPVIAAHEGDVAEAALALKRDPSLAEEILWGGTNGGSIEIVRLCLALIDWANDDPRWFRMLDSALGAWRLGPNRRFHDVESVVYPRILKLFLSRGVSPNVRSKRNESPLHSCATCGVIWGKTIVTPEQRVERATLLLDAGAKFDVRDDLLKSTPLAWAVRWGRTELVELYLSGGARVEESDGESWTTPLAWARRMGRGDLIARLEAARSR
jgi:ankyrin repeat protein